MTKKIKQKKGQPHLIDSCPSRRSAITTSLTVAASLATISHVANAADVGALQAHIKRQKKLKRERQHDEQTGQSWLNSITPSLQPQATAGVPVALRPLYQATANCINYAEVCRQYCHSVLSKSSDANIYACLNTVKQVLPVCGALAKLTELNARNLKHMTQTSIVFLVDCEAACRKVGALHSPCQDCANACLIAIEECRKLSNTSSIVQ